MILAECCFLFTFAGFVVLSLGQSRNVVPWEEMGVGRERGEESNQGEDISKMHTFEFT